MMLVTHQASPIVNFMIQALLEDLIAIQLNQKFIETTGSSYPQDSIRGLDLVTHI
jgi:hypothetical protein